MSYSTMQTRLIALGGNSIDRIRKQKYKSFKSSLKSDYNSRVVKAMNESVMWKCLINDNLLKPDYDRKIISIDYKSGFTSGTTFKCMDDETYWMVYLPDLAEVSYLKSEIIRCRYEIEVNGEKYKVYLQGPTETTIQWFQKSGVRFNSPNWSATLYITKDDNTIDYFHRFTKIRVAGKIWEVHVVDEISVPGIIELELNEYYENEFEEMPDVIEVGEFDRIVGLDALELNQEAFYKIRLKDISDNYNWHLSNDCAKITSISEDGKVCGIQIVSCEEEFVKLYYNDKIFTRIKINKPDVDFPIEGNNEVYPFDVVKYKTSIDGTFEVDNKKLVKILSKTTKELVLEIISPRMGSFNITLTTPEGQIFTLPIKISSL